MNCLAMGHKTGRVMVTGGEDRKVNLWTAGKPNCIMVLFSKCYIDSFSPGEEVCSDIFVYMYFKIFMFSDKLIF